MFRTAFTKTAGSIASRRCLSTSTRLMAGETGSGAARPGGVRSGDAFTKREAAAEELYIRQEEKIKLLAIKEKLQQQREHIDELERHIDETNSDIDRNSDSVTKERSGGDQN